LQVYRPAAWGYDGRRPCDANLSFPKQIFFDVMPLSLHRLLSNRTGYPAIGELPNSRLERHAVNRGIVARPTL
jgi:hypothetical protein